MMTKRSRNKKRKYLMGVGRAKQGREREERDTIRQTEKDTNRKGHKQTGRKRHRQAE